MRVLVLSSAEIEALLDLDGLREAMASALKCLSSGAGMNFPRTVFPLTGESVLGVMPAFASGVAGYKAVAVHPQNRLMGRNPHQGLMVLLDPETGGAQAILEGSTLTAVRTAAVSAVATDCLARRDSQVLAIVGTGRQAFEHFRSLSAVRSFKEVILFGRSSESARALALRLSEAGASRVHVARSAREAVGEADVVVTCTSAKDPVTRASDFRVGAHVNAVGACRPGSREVELCEGDRFRVFVDSRKACLVEADEISGVSIVGEIGQCLSQSVPGRNSSDETTFFKSVGLGIEDVFAAQYFYLRALEAGRGIEVEL